MADYGAFNGSDNYEFYEEIVALAMRGLSLKECGDYYSQDPDDWKLWCERHPLTESRHNTGIARGIALAGQQLLRQIKDGKINAIMFYLKTQGNFMEKSLYRVEEDLNITHALAPTMPSDPVEASKAYQRFMQDS